MLQTQFQLNPVYPNRLELERNVLLAPLGERGAGSGPKISIYISGQSLRLSPARRKFRLVRLLKQAERLISQDYGVTRAREVMRTLWKSDPLKLLEQSGLSLALFHDDSFTGAMNLPIHVEEKMVVARSFHIKPVLTWLQGAPNFWLVSLSGHRVKLYEGTPWELRTRLVVQSPSVLDDEGGRDRSQKSKELVRQFFLKAESQIYPIISKDRYPVVIAGVSWLQPIYRKINRDPDLIAHSIIGNVEKWLEEDLRQVALETLGKLFENVKVGMAAEYEELAWKGLALDDLQKVAAAATRGKVRKMMVASDQTIWGKINSRTGKLTLHPAQLDSEDDDILDDLAEIVLAHGGKVICVPTGDLPTQSPVAAIVSG